MGCFQATAFISSGKAIANVSRHNAQGGEGQGHLIEIGDRSPRFGRHERAGMPGLGAERDIKLDALHLNHFCLVLNDWQA